MGLPKLTILVIVLSRLPTCVFSAPKIVFASVWLAEAEYLCPRPWQTAYLRFLCPQFLFTSAGLAEAEYLCFRPWLIAYLRVLCPQKNLQLLGLPKLILCVNVLGRLPICVFSAPKIVLRGAGLA